MRVIKSFFIAFSMYSRIPVPQFEWKEEDMRYAYCFFPWVGAVVGVCVYLWLRVCGMYQVGIFCRTAIGAAIPLLVTGGFHADGFLDTMDAVHSCQPAKRKLEILKDSHIGAFAVIMFAAYGLFFLGAFSEVKEECLIRIVCSGFFLSRCLSGISAVSFPLAKKKGTLSTFSGSAQKNTVKISLCLQGAVCVALMLRWSVRAGACVSAAAFAALIYYYFQCKKEFGGITGDTAGYFVLLSEGWMLGMAAAINMFVL